MIRHVIVVIMARTEWVLKSLVPVTREISGSGSGGIGGGFSLRGVREVILYGKVLISGNGD